MDIIRDCINVGGNILDARKALQIMSKGVCRYAEDIYGNSPCSGMELSKEDWDSVVDLLTNIAAE